ncbi:MAG: hypothetical protein WCO76_00070 [Planctomycetota bacterium]
MVTATIFFGAVMVVATAAGAAEPMSPRCVGPFVQRVTEHRNLPPGLPPGFLPRRTWIGDDGAVHLGDGVATFRLVTGRFSAASVAAPRRDGGENLSLVAPEADVRQVARRGDGTTAAATSEGVYERVADGPWQRLAPVDERGLVWGTGDIRGVAYDTHGRLVVATPAGVARRGQDGWEFFTGAEGLPVADFTVVASAPDGTVWFGSKIGAVEWSGTSFRYRQGPGWLPGDVVHDLVVAANGDVIVATDGGTGWIAARSTTLAEKARHYEAIIDESISRTEHGFVATADLDVPGDASTARRIDSDNDGLWTALYGAAQCFAYAHDRSADAKRRADRAFRALTFLQEVTQGGEHAPPPGFPARTVLPGDGPDPNVGQEARDRQTRETDPHWKMLEPRWPKSADGRWWWKADTSSDELDGHYFFLAYLAIAAHVTGEARYEAAAEALRRDHAYDANALSPKVQLGVGSGNQSDDEMAFMNLYHLVRYTSDPGLRRAFLGAFHRSWLLERPERNPFFHFAFVATAQEAGADGSVDPSARDALGGADWLDDSIETLVLLPFDRCQWRHTNTHRLDLVRLSATQSIDPGRPDHVPRGYRVDGKVLPVDERSFAHWNTDPWCLDQGGDGRELASGTVFLLPWHMGRYHGFLADD